MDKKEIIAAFWRLEGNLLDFMQKIKDVKNSKLCKCPADTSNVNAWLAGLQLRAKAISMDRELIEASWDSPDWNAILYRENKKQIEKTMAHVINEAKEMMGREIE